MYDKAPVATVLMATYNGSKYIVEQLESILNQTYRPLEIIISDDCSSDNTVDILKKYCSEHDNEHIVTIRVNDANKGVIKNFTDMLDEYKDLKYIFFSDQDDYWMPDKIAIMMAEMLERENNDSGPILVCHNYNIADQNNNVYDKKAIGSVKFEDLVYYPQIPGCCMMINEELSKRLKLDGIRMNMHDWYISLVAALIGENVIIDECLINYRQHEDNVVGFNEDKSSLELVKKYFARMERRKKAYCECYNQMIDVVRIYNENETFDELIDYDNRRKYLKIALWHLKRRVFKRSPFGVYQAMMLRHYLRMD